MGYYDRWDWHAGGDFPADVDPEAGATHIGMFLAWAQTAGLLGSVHTEDSPESVRELVLRRITPGQWFLNHCDGKFWDEDLNEEGNRFALAYYQADSGPNYLSDYDAILSRGVNADLPTLYHIPDTWQTFDQLRPALDIRLAKWRSQSVS